jgi:hypothetical protein
MEFALILRELASHRRLLAVGLVIALIVAILSVARLDGFKLKPRGLQHSSATTEVFIDTPSSVLGNLDQSFVPLTARAAVYANFMASPAVLNLIGQKAGIPGDQLYAAGPIDPEVPRIIEEPTSIQRNVEITGETDPYRLNFNDDPNLPTIGIYAQAPTTPEAIHLANAAVGGLQEYVTGLETSEHIPSASRVIIRQLGQPTGGVSDAGIKKSLALLVFIAVFLAWSVLILTFTRFRNAWRASAVLMGDIDDQGEAARRPRARKAVGRKLAVRAKAAGASASAKPSRGKASAAKQANGKPANGRAPVPAANGNGNGHANGNGNGNGNGKPDGDPATAAANVPRASLRRYRSTPEQETER